MNSNSISLRAIFISILITSLNHIVIAQCPAGLAAGTCTSGNGAASNGVNINGGETYWWTGSGTFASGVNLNGGTLRVCGTLTLSSISFNSGNIIVTSSGNLTINNSGTISLNGNTNITNYGTLTINQSITIQNSNNYIYNESTGTFSCTGTLRAQGNTTNSLVNRGGITINTLDMSNTAPAVCIGNSGQFNVTNIVNNVANAITVSPSNASTNGCVRFTGSATLNASLTSSTNLLICQPSGATASPSNWGSANVTNPCTTSCTVILLPITLGSFIAQMNGNKIELEWSTLTEINFDHFKLQKSLDGINFYNIGEVKANGYSESKQEYSFNDYEPSYGKNYYRLISVDYDNHTEIFQVILVTYIPEDMILVYPNPAKGKITLEILGLKTENYDIETTDIRGAAIELQCILNSDKIDLVNIPPGVYILKIVMSNKVVFRRIVSK